MMAYILELLVDLLLTILSDIFSVVPDVTRPESVASGSSSEPQPSTSCQSPAPPQPLPTVSPILNANWAHEFVTPCSKMSRRNLMSYLERNVRPPPSARREMVRLIDNLPGSHGKKTLAITAQRIVAKYLTGLCCFMFLIEYNKHTT